MCAVRIALLMHESGRVGKHRAAMTEMIQRLVTINRKTHHIWPARPILLRHISFQKSSTTEKGVGYGKGGNEQAQLH